MIKITFYLPAKLKKDFYLSTIDNKTTMSEVIREMIEYYVAQNSKKNN